jgi:hypothetical protein
MKIIVKVNVFVILRHFNRFSNLTSLVVEYLSSSVKTKTFSIYSFRTLRMPFFQIENTNSKNSILMIKKR